MVKTITIAKSKTIDVEGLNKRDKFRKIHVSFTFDVNADEAVNYEELSKQIDKALEYETEQLKKEYANYRKLLHNKK